MRTGLRANIRACSRAAVPASVHACARLCVREPSGIHYLSGNMQAYAAVWNDACMHIDTYSVAKPGRW
eukprot:6183521-Pleurochrysis_carterae.AAC.2